MMFGLTVVVGATEVGGVTEAGGLTEAGGVTEVGGVTEAGSVITPLETPTIQDRKMSNVKCQHVYMQPNEDNNSFLLPDESNEDTG